MSLSTFLFYSRYSYIFGDNRAITAGFLRGCYNFGIINRNDLNFLKFNFLSIDICIWSELFYAGIFTFSLKVKECWRETRAPYKIYRANLP